MTDIAEIKKMIERTQRDLTAIKRHLGIISGEARAATKVIKKFDSTSPEGKMLCKLTRRREMLDNMASEEMAEGDYLLIKQSSADIFADYLLQQTQEEGGI